MSADNFGSAAAAVVPHGTFLDLDDSLVVSVARAHIGAWSCHDWVKTRALLAPDVRVLVTTLSPQWRVSEYVGVESYMLPKMKAAQLIVPGSVHLISAIGDEARATVISTMKMELGSRPKIATLVRTCLYLINENGLIKEEMDQFLVLS